MRVWNEDILGILRDWGLAATEKHVTERDAIATVATALLAA